MYDIASKVDDLVSAMEQEDFACQKDLARALVDEESSLSREDYEKIARAACSLHPELSYGDVGEEDGDVSVVVVWERGSDAVVRRRVDGIVLLLNLRDQSGRGVETAFDIDVVPFYDEGVCVEYWVHARGDEPAEDLVGLLKAVMEGKPIHSVVVHYRGFYDGHSFKEFKSLEEVDTTVPVETIQAVAKLS